MRTAAVLFVIGLACLQGESQARALHSRTSCPGAWSMACREMAGRSLRVDGCPEKRGS